MEVYLQIKGGPQIEGISPLQLSESSDIALSQKRERDEFKRTVDDVSLEASNLDGKLGAALLQRPITTYWQVIIRDRGITLFNGRVHRPIQFNLKDEWINLQVYSNNKDFWEKAKTTKIKAVDSTKLYSKVYTSLSEIEALIYTTVSQVLIDNCEGMQSEGLFTGYDIDSLYATRPVRYAFKATMFPPLATIGDNGRYENLDPNTSVFDLLTAMAKYYNAEFFVDPATDKLTMRRRLSILNDTKYDLDEVISDDDEIMLVDTDEKKYDYLHTFISISQPADLLQYDRYSSDYTTSDIYCYADLYSYGILSAPSAPGSFRQVKIGNLYYPAFIIPQRPSDVIARYVYKKDVRGTFRLHFVLTGNEGTTYAPYISDIVLSRSGTFGHVVEDIEQLAIHCTLFIDWLGPANPGNIALNPNTPTGHIWWSYDEATAKWNTITGYDGADTPVGKIFEILPELQFVDDEGKPKQSNPSEVFAFFGKEQSLDNFTRQWQDMFITTKALHCTARGTHYRYGDTFITNKLRTNASLSGASKFIVKEATSQLVKEKTQLVLVSK